MYKALSKVRSDEDVARIREEMLDRYGNPPKSVSSLREVASFRARARQAGIAEVTLAAKNISFPPVALLVPPQVRLRSDERRVRIAYINTFIRRGSLWN